MDASSPVRFNRRTRAKMMGSTFNLIRSRRPLRIRRTTTSTQASILMIKAPQQSQRLLKASTILILKGINSPHLTKMTSFPTPGSRSSLHKSSPLKFSRTRISIILDLMTSMVGRGRGARRRFHKKSTINLIQIRLIRPRINLRWRRRKMWPRLSRVGRCRNNNNSKISTIRTARKPSVGSPTSSPPRQ